MKALAPLLVAAGVALLLVAGLAASCAPKAPTSARPGARLVVVPIGARKPDTDRPVAFVEVSSTPETRSRGLGGRDRLAPDSGMLFVYATDDVRNYWMKDCVLALDIAFIDRDQRIASVATLPPGAGRPDQEIARAGSKVPARYVLETSAGWMAGHGLGVGDEVDLTAALVGVQAR